MTLEEAQKMEAEQFALENPAPPLEPGPAPEVPMPTVAITPAEFPSPEPFMHPDKIAKPEVPDPTPEYAPVVKAKAKKVKA